MKKRTLSLLLMLAMLLTLIPAVGAAPAAGADTFSDVSSGDWFAEYVDYVTEKGLMNGVGRGKFDPNGNMSRAMVVTVLYRAANEPGIVSDGKFTDVPADEWYTDAVAWAASNGYVKGVTNTTFEPNRDITREEMVTILHRYEGSPEVKSDYDRFLDKNAVSEYAEGPMKWAVASKIIQGFEDGTIRPSGKLTRAEAAKMLTVMLELGNRRTLVVAQDGSGDYTTIQAAVNDAVPGDTILVHEGVYREEVVFPCGGTSESNRITLKAATGEEVVVTGSQPVSGWTATADTGVYTISIEKDFFGKNAEGEYFNPFAVNWMSKGGQYPDFFSCGCVYLNDTVLDQKWSVDDVKATANTWIAAVDPDTGVTTVTANFGSANPNAKGNVTEVNNRMQCVTAKWNQGYVTIDGLTVMRGCGPKTIDFWMTTAEAMYGAIATNGGHHWIIENCNVTQCRGVGIDFGSGSAKQEKKYGGEPDLYGYHIIRNCDVHDNGTNGMMAYRGPYTEIYGCTLVNNNAMNTGLLSEAYIKDVSGGFGINIHDNYFYSDQDGAARPIWLDCECDGSMVTNNVICDANNGFTYVDLECNAGWILVANNVLISTGWGQVLQSHAYLVNNLVLMNGQTSNTTWNSNSSTAMPGAEGYDGYSRALRAMKPGTLDVLGQEETSRFETYNRFNKLLNNIIFDQGPVAATSGRGEDQTVVKAPNAADFNGIYTEVYLNPDPEVNPDYSDGCWKDPAMNEKYAGKKAWIPVEGETSLGTATMVYGNECDYNVYYGGAGKIDQQYSDEYTADEHSIAVAGGKYSFTATPESFQLTLTVDDAPTAIKAPHITGKYLGAATLYEQEGVTDWYAPDVDTDFFGNARDPKSTVAGPFADLTVGENHYTLWPKAGS